MNKYIGGIIFPFLLILVAVPVSASAFSFGYVHQYNYSSYDEAGFFSGIWHGLIAPYSLIARWFGPLNDSFNMDMYAYSNTGWFYDFGFLLGILGSIPIGWLAAIVAFVVTLL